MATVEQENPHRVRAQRSKAVALASTLLETSGSAADAVEAVEQMCGPEWFLIAGMAGQAIPSRETRGMVHRALIFKAALDDLLGPFARELFR